MSTVLAFDVETQLLAEEVAEQYAERLAEASAWEYPALFGFAAGVIVDVESEEARYYGPAQATEMIAKLSEAEVTCGFNSSGFDLGVLSGYAEVSGIYPRHIDLRLEVKAALRASKECESLGEKLHAGSLDAIARANDLGGKTGSGVDAPALYRSGRILELLSYCEADTRLTAALYRRLGEDRLCVEPSYYCDGERVQLGRRLLISLQG